MRWNARPVAGRHDYLNHNEAVCIKSFWNTKVMNLATFTPGATNKDRHFACFYVAHRLGILRWRFADSHAAFTRNFYLCINRNVKQIGCAVKNRCSTVQELTLEVGLPRLTVFNGEAFTLERKNDSFYTVGRDMK